VELKEWPGTELAYWRTIETLGGFIWRLNHDAADGRITMTPGMEKDLQDAQKIQESLVSELFVRFGVIHPKDCPQRKADGEMPSAPLGTMWYWDWYRKMKAESCRDEYEKIICSACPLSEGVEAFIATNTIPCTAWRGSLYNLPQPSVCAMLHMGPQWSRRKLIANIRAKGGAEAVPRFKAKEAELKAAA
jgi:hypothetical protein